MWFSTIFLFSFSSVESRSKFLPGSFAILICFSEFFVNAFSYFSRNLCTQRTFLYRFRHYHGVAANRWCLLHRSANIFVWDFANGVISDCHHHSLAETYCPEPRWNSAADSERAIANRVRVSIAKEFCINCGFITLVDSLIKLIRSKI